MNAPLAAGTVIGRYAVYGDIASGGMATVHFGRLIGPAGFSRTVAIKRLHPQFAKDPEFCSMLLDEARLAARISHPNVVAVLDVVARAGELFLVMEYVQGEAPSTLFRTASARGACIPNRVAIAIATGALYGLHAAHEAKSGRGEPLGMVHRDVSPQNILVGTDGIARVLDFGVAKAVGRAQMTREGQLKGKLSYMSPEQIRGESVDRRTDVYAASVVLWEMLTGRRLFADDNAAVVSHLASEPTAAPSRYADVDASIDAIVVRGLARDPKARFATAREMAIALESTGELASAREVGEWVERLAETILHARAAAVHEFERVSSVTASVVQPAIAPASDRPQLSSSGSPRIHAGALIGLGAILLLAMASAIALELHGKRVSAQQESSIATPKPDPAASAVAAPQDASPDPDPAAPVAVSSEPTERAPRAAPPPVHKRTPPSTGNRCTPPYTIAPDGVRQYKPECLK